MADPSSASSGRTDDPSDDAEADGGPTGGDPDGGAGADANGGAGADVDADVDALRAEVEEKYDFDDFGPADMAEMTPEEWDAAFDADSWVVGPELLDKLERELRNRVATREVFAVLERGVRDGEEVLLAYSDEGYALVYEDGSVEGRGTVLRDVKPSVALCSMDDYEPDGAAADVPLPTPEEVNQGSGEFGNRMLQLVAGVQLLAGVVLFGAWALTGLGVGGIGVDTIVAPAAAIAFFVVGVFLFTVVANARLSDRFRAEEYRDRLRDIGLEDGERPGFVPSLDEAREGDERGADD